MNWPVLRRQPPARSMARPAAVGGFVAAMIGGMLLVTFWPSLYRYLRMRQM